MEIENRIKKIKDYFSGMEIVPTETENGTIVVAYVSVKFPEKWIIGEETKEKFNVGVYRENELGDYIQFYCDLETGLGNLFDAIEYNINENIIAEKKVSILHEKMNELKKLFEDENYNVEELDKLSFEIQKEKKNGHIKITGGCSASEPHASIKKSLKKTPSEEGEMELSCPKGEDKEYVQTSCQKNENKKESKKEVNGK